MSHTSVTQSWNEKFLRCKTKASPGKAWVGMSWYHPVQQINNKNNLKKSEKVVWLIISFRLLVEITCFLNRNESGTVSWGEW